MLLLVGDFRKAPGSSRRILANVYRFDYVDQNGSILASIEKPPAKASVVSEAEVVGKTQAKILELAHLPPLGSDWPTLRQTLSGNYGFALSYAVAYDDGKVEIRDGKVVREDLDEAKPLHLGFGNDRKPVAGMFAKQSPV
ncbi:hypothetical protein ACFPTV_16860 [Sinirhodobacter huangdaonensis]|uniref:hypothetical protein n=1 Tax=Paenirhodobacter huangdaonensis TaxID=2501515 RepID=UPI000FE3F477|nr:hypothetical protein [Sinirhodobacter huangdaonensis]